ncbi:transposase [Amphibacillus cookii]|uniref:transposase n=1 Tax=Amphibacillus cookii TaxID=767787 RepID=UPI00195D22B8|nr:transposase [Amphibacillus cookii]MBM7542823.1 transposase [Amphibacillus cookii]
MSYSRSLHMLRRFKNEDYTIYKNGTQCSRMTLPIGGVKKSYLNLRKQRFKCKACGNTFTVATSLVEKHCYLSKYTKARVLIKAAEAQSLKDIAKDTAVSATTVQRLMTKEKCTERTIYFCIAFTVKFSSQKKRRYLICTLE